MVLDCYGAIRLNLDILSPIILSKLGLLNYVLAPKGDPCSEQAIMCYG
jgi:hypothetical protein